MRKANVISGVILMCLCLLGLTFLIPSQIEQGPPDMMSPRLVPNMMLVLIAALAALLVVQNWGAGRAVAERDKPPISVEDLFWLMKIGGVFGISIAGHLLVGPLVGAIVLLDGTLLLLGERRLVILLGLPALILGGIYVLYYHVLGTAIL